MRSVELVGILPAMVTPVTPDGEEIDEEALRALTRRLIDAGVGGLVTCGSTGEFASLSNLERRRVTEIVVVEAAGRVPVVAGTGALTTKEVIELSRHAEHAGAAGVMVVPPFYEPLRWEELVTHYRAIAESIDIPIIFYNIPVLTGTHLTGDQIRQLADIEGIEFVKDSTADMVALTELIQRYSKDIAMFNGVDTLTFYAFAIGTPAAIWGAANFMPDLCVQLFDLLYRRQELAPARQLWDKMWPICDFLQNEGYAQSVKAACELAGIKVGPPRRPLLPVSGEARERLAKLLGAAGLLAEAEEYGVVGSAHAR